mmetsp:Transcript_104984/g.338545  ORF Transcript_104984/g.338545 Transcript_104984/m.338545 type:complete len:298 (-) Transcript_104984:446-1339(-)
MFAVSTTTPSVSVCCQHAAASLISCSMFAAFAALRASKSRTADPRSPLGTWWGASVPAPLPRSLNALATQACSAMCSTSARVHSSAPKRPRPLSWPMSSRMRLSSRLVSSTSRSARAVRSASSAKPRRCTSPDFSSSQIMPALALLSQRAVSSANSLSSLLTDSAACASSCCAPPTTPPAAAPSTAASSRRNDPASSASSRRVAAAPLGGATSATSFRSSRFRRSATSTSSCRVATSRSLTMPSPASSSLSSACPALISSSSICRHLQSLDSRASARRTCICSASWRPPTPPPSSAS